jgi:hypothetical protein
MAVVPEQLQPAPLRDAAVKPVGSVSVTVVVPEVTLDAPAVFDTVMVSVPPVCPCVNVPLDPSLTPKTGSTITLIWPLVPVMDELTKSVAVTVWLPAAASVAENVPEPEASMALDGRVADPSLLVKWTVPVYPVAVLLPASRAVTVKLNDVPEVAELGVDTEKCVAAPAVLLSEKFTVVRLPDDAVTV